MPIPLTLGLPHRPNPNALLDGLLHPVVLDPAAVVRGPRPPECAPSEFAPLECAPPVVPASALLARNVAEDLGRVVVYLDVDPDELRAGPAGGYEAVRFHIDASAEHLAEALSLRLPSPLAVFPKFDAIDVAETTERVVLAHRSPGISVGDAPRRIADVLAVVSHSDVGFVARAETGDEVISILAATVASLRGDDIRAALAAPNVAALSALGPEAAEAVREVLIGVEIADALGARTRLVEVGLIAE